ncbi:MAG: alpha/beta hydrolase [Pseudomonadales bacterium]|jgi:pimeloyl-ACP methyl ester carboxylesterase|nr:alpha/beta hydrolase [Pseudomonadales bacterium]MDP7358605.1 alpha/beta hydrolase [Pseudomonadales bacterium]MDP7596933.1 alpha/beta hydrolase [Pseudomonadales bacterium]HJN49755.1 alpha/beta hydrolase [Pseudomonadales bacterium]|tara:strand:- start:1691 stop:2491 length:801 start_codon:yes stop_codon:yes gene_type:complete
MSAPIPYFEVHGDRGPYLLLMHGMLSGRSQWLLNLPALTAACRPVVVELWGHGRSPAPDDPALYSYRGYLDSFERIRSELGIDDWFVCGQSFGATLTIRYAIQYPERTNGQIFTNSASALVAAAGQDSSQSRPDLEKHAQAIAAGGLKLIEQMRIHPSHARNLPKEAKQALLADAALINPRAIAMIFRHINGSSVVDLLPRNSVPSLLVCGSREKSFTPGRIAAEQNMPHLEVVMAEAGHTVNIQRADVFNDSVIDFIQRHGKDSN